MILMSRMFANKIERTSIWTTEKILVGWLDIIELYDPSILAGINRFRAKTTGIVDTSLKSNIDTQKSHVWKEIQFPNHRRTILGSSPKHSSPTSLAGFSKPSFLVSMLEFVGVVLWLKSESFQKTTWQTRSDVQRAKKQDMDKVKG